MRPPPTRPRSPTASPAGEWVVDLRHRVAFAEGHVPGTYNFEADGQLATYLAWLIPWGKPVTLLAESPDQLAEAQRELVRVGIDRPAAAATGGPADWLPPGTAPASFRRATFAELARERPAAVLDVRRDSERSGRRIEGSLHIPLHTLAGRLGELPEGPVWVHCSRRHARRRRRLPAGRRRPRGGRRRRLARPRRGRRTHRHLSPTRTPPPHRRTNGTTPHHVPPRLSPAPVRPLRGTA